MAAKRKITPEQRARMLAEVHRAAQERLGLTAAIEVLATYEQLFNAQKTGSAPAVKARVKRVVKALRATSRALSGHYYALSRAMQTGFSVSDLEGHRRTGQIHMSDLYKDMATALNEVLGVTPKPPESAPGPTTPASNSDGSTDGQQGLNGQSETPSTPAAREERVDELVDTIMQAFTDLLPDESSDEWTDRVEIDEFDWPPDDPESEDLLDQFVDDERKEFEAERKRILKDQKLSHDRAMQKTQDAADRLAASVANKTIKTVIDSSRSVVEQSAIKDRRCVGWMRVTGTQPCGWCAMLASRGAAYHTETSAGGNGNLYHDNCCCTPFPVYSDHPFFSERDLFFINHWAPVTKGLNRKESLTIWRRWLKEQYASGSVPDQDSFRGPPSR